MRPRKRGVGTVLLLLLALGVGFILGVAGASWQYYRFVFSKQVDLESVQLADNLRTVALLRLGEADPVIKRLELTIDSAIVSVALTPHVRMTDARRKALSAAGAYRRVCPSQSELAGKVTDALKDVPPMQTAGRTSALSRLVERDAPKTPR